MLSKSDIKAIEKKFGFRPQKKLGQNFLIDKNIKNKLLEAAGIEESDVVLEIGPGLGQLTFDIASRAKEVIAVEFDRKLFAILSSLAKDAKNIKLVHQDFLRSDIGALLPADRKAKIVSNLPYCVSTAVILKLLECKERVEFALLTLQKEVADRLTAKPNEKDYGSLTLFTSFSAEVSRVCSVKRNSFYPIPQVDSAAVLIRPRTAPAVEVDDENKMFELIRAGFSSRRKTLVNALSAKDYKGLSKTAIQNTLQEAGIPKNARAESLYLADFARIASLLTP